MVSGIYGIYLEGSGRFVDAYCDMDTAGGGWTVIQRRMDGSVDIDKTWAEYKKGFGSVSAEHWLGNDNIHFLTSLKTYRLRIDLVDFYGNTSNATYKPFRVGNESVNYKLEIGSYSGSAGDALRVHHGNGFTTKDRDNDLCIHNCGVLFNSGWWFRKCLTSNLNGIYTDIGLSTKQYEGLAWTTWPDTYFITWTEMKVRPLRED
ncbi:ficolin-1-like [Lytechinus pictus]|uniref:ficolin-1-like n=1 Tax=Lytechinus pictus TaxID=7653 RepID=UPI0030BA0517